MVGKVDNMVTAAVVIDSAFSSGSSYTKSQNATTQVKSVESKQPSQSSTNMLKTQEPRTSIQKTEEDNQAQEQSFSKMSEDAVKQMVDELNKVMKDNKINLRFEFNYDKELKMLNVKVIDPETKKVLREFPPEDMLENMKKTREWLGAIIDEIV